MSISEQIEASFGDGPAHRSLEDRLSAGRRARRRRKGAEGVAAVAGVAVLGLVAYGIAPGGTPDSAEDPVYSGKPTASATASGSPTGKALKPLEEGQWAEYDADGNVVLADGVTELQRVPNPLDWPLPKRSVGLEVERAGKKVWMLLEYEPGSGTSASADPAQKSFATLQEWLDYQVALHTGGEQLQLVEFGTGETLEPLPGVTIVQQRPSPDVGDDFAGQGDRSAVAEVRVDGDTWFVLARDLDGPPQYIPTAAIAGRQTLAEFLVYARGQYAGGEGLL
ncbi:hypothetical protein [Nocardioides speluncae]|uniref:hypothetical protein n=1 Tax=Nocardioides speluncae TaxID=2670337 RepID=UPI000D68BFC7|nr:hypothetical protein [Nocardioides speluncae]